MTNTKPVKQRLPTTKLTKSIEINHNVKFLAQSQRSYLKKIFQYADQQNQRPKQKTTMTRSLTTTRNTLHTARVLPS